MAANFHKWHVQAAIDHFNEVLAFASLPLVTRQIIGALPGELWNVGDWLRFMPPEFSDWPEAIQVPYEAEGFGATAETAWIVPADPSWVLHYAVTRYKEKFSYGAVVGWTADEIPELGVRISLGQFQVGADSLLAAAFQLLRKIEETDP
jgi:hypothetical protein